MAPDTGFYWGASYTFGYQPSQNEWRDVVSRRFIGDFTTGDILATSGVQDGKLNPASYSLGQNYPNPFNPTTSVKFTIKEYSYVTLKVYDVLGKEVAVLVNGELSAGEHTAVFDGNKLSSGVYFYRLNAQAMNGKQSFTQTKKLLLLK